MKLKPQNLQCVRWSNAPFAKRCSPVPTLLDIEQCTCLTRKGPVCWLTASKNILVRKSKGDSGNTIQVQNSTEPGNFKAACHDNQCRDALGVTHSNLKV